MHRDHCRRYVYLDKVAYPVLVSVHADIAEAFDAFDDHEDFGGSCPLPNRYHMGTFCIVVAFHTSQGCGSGK